MHSHPSDRLQTRPKGPSAATGASADPAESDVGGDPGRDAGDWLRTARAAREAGRLAEACVLLEKAAQRFPDSAAVMHDLARIAEATLDWREAERHWRGFLALATHLWWAHTGLANALREQGRLRDADAVLTGQFERLAQEPWIFFEYALLAERAQDWPEAAKRWAGVTMRFSHVWEGYCGQSRALRQLENLPAARRLLSEAAAGFPDLAQPFHDIARLAEADQDWVAAEQAWRGFLARDKGEWWAHAGLAHALRRQDRFDEADAVLTGQFAGPVQETGLFFEYAAIAEDRGDWAEAVERYRTFMRRYPDLPHAARRLARVLRRLGRRAEGDDILRQAIAANPGNLMLRLAFSRNVAEIIPDGATEFLARTRQTLLDFPDEPEAHGFLADAFAANGLFDKAEGCLAAACARFPGNADLLLRWATDLAQQAKWDSALTVFDQLDRVRPPDEQAECDVTEMLITAGRWEAAETRLTAALGRFPEAAMLHVLRLDGMIASGRLDLAIGQWREIERKFPADVEGLLFERRNRMLGLGHDPVEAAPAGVARFGTLALGVARPGVARSRVAPTEHRPIRAEDVVMQFESLGGWGLGCEFGLVQRAMGAEPLGLLRWADIDTDGLAGALEAGFEGVGLPDQTVLEPTGGALDEYVSEDRRFGMRIHSYVPAGQVGAERMLAQTCRRLSFLRRKLLDDLHRADKILVYKNARRPLTGRELERLRLAIRRYGDNTLLYVRYQNEEHRFPSVISPAPGLLIGHIDRMGLTPEGVPMPIPFDSWAALVLNVHALLQTADPKGRPSDLGAIDSDNN